MSKRGRPPLVPNTRSEPFAVRLPLPLYDALTKRAAEMHITPRQFVRDAVQFVLINSVSPPAARQ